MKDQIDWLRLVRSRRVGPATFVRLLTEYQSASAALDALPNIAKNAGVKRYEPYDAKVTERELDQGNSLGLIPLFLGSPDYPKLLEKCNDAPAFLWAKGNSELAQKPCISLVGARNASSLGLRMAKNIAAELGEMGFVVVSGLARGIDTAVHNASIHAGTIAVQGGGIDISYPKENQALQTEIGETGLRLSEQPIGLIPQARHFPQRNRIVAGVSSAVVVIEGAARSGSLITARAAADIGREVMAVPGNPLDGRASGCNILIRDGATLVRNATDIAELVSTEPVQPASSLEPNQMPSAPKNGDITSVIMNVLSTSGVSEDTVIRDTGLAAQDVSKMLTTLEIEGKIERQAGGLLARTA